ncbi:hypothetical protein PTNB73_09296 [Pyrenophora teres f. teres]|nr:hypothetical protein HRS9139_09519 [Pyrenophora teres f. teres]KAE8831165.1 hypothetical protein HRS9122_08755 [Pyrenophora teres f. teres]KAE8858048.1 hypothetical protein PTNB73_09296 [Pyrenophora teres f. teres]
MHFSTATIALAAAFLLNLGTAAALPVDDDARVAAPVAETTNMETRSLAKRAYYTHCACQYSHQSGIDALTTNRVASYNPHRWKLGSFVPPACCGSLIETRTVGLTIRTTDEVETPRGRYGAHFTGFYVHSLNGRIYGEGFYQECKQNGAGDSTCFGRK